jgi:hypothetical protein
MKSISDIATRGLVLDGAIFLFNLLLAAPLAQVIEADQGFHPLFGGALFAAIAAYSVGAWLKRLPLQSRLQTPDRPKLPTGMAVVFFVLAVMHLGLFLACASFGTEAFFGEAGDNHYALPAMIAGFLPTVMLVWAIIPPGKPAVDSARLAFRELIADLLLGLALVVIMVWWEGFWAAYLAGGKQGSVWMNLLLVVLITVPFAIFYLSPRFLFLLEDWRSPSTWIRALLVMLPLARHLLL